MTGLDEGRLLAYLDGELEGAERADLEAWLEESPEARASLEEVRRRRAVVADAVASLPSPPPDLSEMRAEVERRVRRGRTEAPGTHPASDTEGTRRTAASPSRWRRNRLAQAAVLVLMLGAAGVSAAVPGSPVRAWLASILADDPSPASAVAAPEGDAETGPDETGEMGLRVRPADGRLEIVLSGVPTHREVVVRLVDDGHGAVFAPLASFRSGSGRIDASVGEGEDPVRVEIPRSVPSATLRVDGRLWLEKTGERLDFPGPTARVSGDTMRFGGEG